jgi:hypothetical protein
MNCQDFLERLPLLPYGEVSFETEEAMERHSMECQSCHREREKAIALHALLDEDRPAIPTELLGKCRREVHLNVEARGAAAPSGSWFGRLFGSWLAPVGVPGSPVWVRAAGALALVALGVFLGRTEIFSASRLAAIAWSRSETVPTSRVRYVDPDASGRVRLVVDETRQRQLSGPAGDESIRRLLLTAAEDPSDPGLRAESIDVLKVHSDDEDVRKALLNALSNDSNSGVRLKALEGLRAYAREPETRQALCQVLLTDDNAGIRAQAVDLLVQHKEPAIAGVLQESLRREENSYVRARTLKALAEMKASAGTF